MTHSISLLKEAKKAHLLDTDISYFDIGSGADTVVLVHGLAGNKLLWKDSLRAFAEAGFRVIAVDLPGHGQSSHLIPSNYSLEIYVEFLNSLIQNLDIKKVNLIGHSMGAQIAVHLAVKHPKQVSNLILCSPAGFEVFNTVQSLSLRTFIIPTFLRYLNKHSLRSFIEDNFHQWSDEYAWITRYYEQQLEQKKRHQLMQVFGDSVAAMLNEPVHHLLKKISQPTLVVAGEEDRYIPNRLFKRINTAAIMQNGAEKIQNSRLIMIPKAGHLVNMEYPALFNQAVVDFIVENNTQQHKLVG